MLIYDRFFILYTASVLATLVFFQEYISGGSAASFLVKLMLSLVFLPFLFRLNTKPTKPE